MRSYIFTKFIVSRTETQCKDLGKGGMFRGIGRDKFPYAVRINPFTLVCKLAVSWLIKV